MSIVIFKHYNLSNDIQIKIYNYLQEYPKELLINIKKRYIYNKYIKNNKDSIFKNYLRIDNLYIDTDFNKRMNIINNTLFDRYIDIDFSIFDKIINFIRSGVFKFTYFTVDYINKVIHTFKKLNINKIINPLWLFYLYDNNVYMYINSIFTNEKIGGTFDYDENISFYNGTLSCISGNDNPYITLLSNIYYNIII